MQEQDGAYGSIVIEPKDREAFKFDREYVVVLSDSHGDSGDRILANLKKTSDYYSRQQRTVGDFFRDVGEKGLAATVQDRLDWGSMRIMAPAVANSEARHGGTAGGMTCRLWWSLFQ